MTIAEKINRSNCGWRAEMQEDGQAEITWQNGEQDYVFYAKDADEIYEYWQNFDVEEEVTMWLDAKRNGVQGVPNLLRLVAEEQAIDHDLEELAIRVAQYKD